MIWKGVIKFVGSEIGAYNMQELELYSTLYTLVPV